MATRRFTDCTKWRNEWFRTLPFKAKLVWIYLCDECDFSGVWKADYGLASFQVNFKFNQTDLKEWFESKLYFIEDKVVIAQFFEFQYSTSKDSWSAKINAQQHLESLGFKIQNHKLIYGLSPHSPPTVGVQSPDYTVIVKGKGKDLKEGGVGETNENRFQPDLEFVYAMYPRKVGKQKGLERLKAQIRTQKDYEDLCRACVRYTEHCRSNQTEQRFIKHFSSWVSEWRDWLDPSTGSGTDFSGTAPHLSLAERLALKEKKQQEGVA